MRAIIGIVIGLLLGSTIAPAADKVRVSGGGITPLHSIIWVANQEGLFKKHGLDVEYLTMNSGTLGVQTLLSNESQLLFSTGALVTANVQGADIAMITGGLICSPSRWWVARILKVFRICAARKFRSANSAPPPILLFRRLWKSSAWIQNRSQSFS